MNMSRCSFWNKLNREKMKETCCLYALGELSPEENLSLEKHLRNCQECRALVGEFERIVFFDLPSVAVLRSCGSVPEDVDSISGDELLRNIRERAKTPFEQRERRFSAQNACFAPPTMSRSGMLRFAGLSALAAGWLLAAVVILAHGRTRPRVHGLENTISQQKGSDRQALEAEHARLGVKLKAAGANVETLKRKLEAVSGRVRTGQSELSRLRTQYRDLNGSFFDLNSKLEQEESLLERRSAEVQFTRDELNSEIAAKDSLQRRLFDVSRRLDKQTQELARLERVAAEVPAAYPLTQATVSEGEAREILGARDLHIFDVHDVDDSGKASRVYGRVYYVNHSQLIFYAFDLPRLEKNHRLVAFQAWGFRQPTSSNVESLGLFYLDSATLNRWALRVSDPGILSRIDTLFVTIEPPGGSRVPKGRRLLMASLAGPPNHP